MRKLLIISCVCIPVAGMAQTLSPSDEAMQQRIIACTGDALNWQTQAIIEKRRADDLQKQIDAMKKPAEIPAK